MSDERMSAEQIKTAIARAKQLPNENREYETFLALIALTSGEQRTADENDITKMIDWYNFHAQMIEMYPKGLLTISFEGDQPLFALNSLGLEFAKEVLEK